MSQNFFTLRLFKEAALCTWLFSVECPVIVIVLKINYKEHGEKCS